LSVIAMQLIKFSC